MEYTKGFIPKEVTNIRLDIFFYMHYSNPNDTPFCKGDAFNNNLYSKTSKRFLISASSPTSMMMSIIPNYLNIGLENQFNIYTLKGSLDNHETA